MVKVFEIDRVAAVVFRNRRKFYVKLKSFKAPDGWLENYIIHTCIYSSPLSFVFSQYRGYVSFGPVCSLTVKTHTNSVCSLYNISCGF